MHSIRRGAGRGLAFTVTQSDSTVFTGVSVTVSLWGSKEIKTRITCHLLRVIKESGFGDKPRLIGPARLFSEGWLTAFLSVF